VRLAAVAHACSAAPCKQWQPVPTPASSPGGQRAAGSMCRIIRSTIAAECMHCMQVPAAPRRVVLHESPRDRRDGRLIAATPAARSRLLCNGREALFQRVQLAGRAAIPRGAVARGDEGPEACAAALDLAQLVLKAHEAVVQPILREHPRLGLEVCRGSCAQRPRHACACM
jgi:hypothetical protein